jgi:hypothetical protein
MFICGYHFPAEEGNNVAFEKVVEKVTEGAGDLSGVNSVTLTGETAKGQIVENITLEKGTFLFTAMVDYFKNAEIPGDEKMVYYTNKYQMSEISKAVDGEKTKEICKKLDDMNLYRVKVA